MDERSPAFLSREALSFTVGFCSSDKFCISMFYLYEMVMRVDAGGGRMHSNALPLNKARNHVDPLL